MQISIEQANNKLVTVYAKEYQMYPALIKFAVTYTFNFSYITFKNKIHDHHWLIDYRLVVFLCLIEQF